MSSAYTVPLFLRGEVIAGDLVSFGTRSGGAEFQAPDMSMYVDRLPLASPMAMADLYEVSFDEILDVLEALGDALVFETNTHLQEAYEAALLANPLPAAMLKNSYQILQPLCSRANVLEVADSQVGLDYLNGWVPRTLADGRELRVRAFGSRVLHIPAGNGGLVSAVTILRSVITRSDAIIKAWGGRHRRRQPGGMCERPRYLCHERHRPRRHRQRQPAGRDDLSGAGQPARVHQHTAAVPEPGTLRPCRGVTIDRRLVPRGRRHRT